jgi:tripartite-type tricarboxylate transporter receptor subunit TctC
MKTMYRGKGGAFARALLLGALPAAFLSGAASAQDLAAFYKTNPLQIVVGYGPGGGYDAYARVLGRHMGKHLPGSPNIVVQNMPGAASMKAANYLYAIAPKDGSQIGTFSRGLPMQPLLDKQGVQYDALKFGWVGSVASETSVMFAWEGTGFKTFEDTQQKEMLVSASGAGADSATFPWITNAVLGTKFRVITGYPDANSTMLAVERGEVQGSAGTSWGSLTSSRGDWLTKNRIVILAQLGLNANPAIGKAPLIVDLAKNAADRQVLEMIFARQSFAYPYTAPPGIAPDRLAALRTAFNATMKDSAFLADATKMGLEVTPITGEELSGLLEKLYKTPPEVVERARAAIDAGKATAKK